jgi:hypothetical protein
VTAVNGHFMKHDIKRMFGEYEKDTRGDRPRSDWYEEQCRMPYPDESDYYSDRSSDRERRRLRDIKRFYDRAVNGKSRSRTHSVSNSFNRVDGRSYSDAARESIKLTSSQDVRDPSSNVSFKQSVIDVNETSQQLGVDALNQTRSDDQSNVAMITVDTEADVQLTLQLTSWRHSTAKGTAKSFIQAIPAQIFPYRSVTDYSIT